MLDPWRRAQSLEGESRGPLFGGSATAVPHIFEARIVVVGRQAVRLAMIGVIGHAVVACPQRHECPPRRCLGSDEPDNEPRCDGGTQVSRRLPPLPAQAREARLPGSHRGQTPSGACAVCRKYPCRTPATVFWGAVAV